ncbi:MAG: phosphatidylglycerophosphatase A [Bdellovibrionales bacterium]|nr:phosphatidylglycerophosphatase A [Bdellovibrionales bacterium]
MALTRLRTPRDVLVTLVATFFGAGLFPKAPGTVGSLAALPLVGFVNLTEGSFKFFFWLAVILGGAWAARRYDELLHTKDNGSIVIDEVAGMGIAAWSAAGSPVTLFIAFLAFRVLDIVKPYPIRDVDRWSKEQTGFFGGLGVMIDDVLAGLAVLVGIALLQWVGLLG